jgi:hypothetical protein
MAYLPGFDYDIFISYAHVDDLTTNEEEEGWVTLFHKHLEVQLSKLVGRADLVKIWRDERRLQGNHLFDQTIRDGVDRAALFLALTSNGYLGSEYCQQELKWFCDKAAREPWTIDVGDRRRVFNLLLNNIPHDRWPQEYGRSSGHPFNDAERKEQLGYPTEARQELFRRQMRDLCEAIYATLSAIKAAPVASPIAAPVQQLDNTPAKSSAATSFSVFLADTPDSLRTLRRRIANELQQQGISLAAQIPPPYEATQHDERVISEMSNAQLAVHLLDEWPGREVEGAPEESYPQRQARLGLQHAPAQLIWTPQSLVIEKVEDENHRRFLDQLENQPREHASYSFIREAPGAIGRLIVARLEQIKQASETPRAPSAALLDTHLKDELHALELSRFLIGRNILPYVNPEQDDPSRNIALLEERLKRVSRLIIVFGNVAEDWVRARLGEAVKIAVTESCPLKACGIYYAPPRRKAEAVKFSLGFLPIYQFDSTDLINPQALQPLLEDAP